MNRRQFSALLASAAAARLLPAAPPAPTTATQPSAAGVVNVGLQKQLFIDDLFFAKQTGVTLTVNRPVLTHEKCIVAEKPWESHRVGPYVSVLEDDGKFHMWYDAISTSGLRMLCYATSEDGIHWEKPVTSVQARLGFATSNIVFPPNPGFFEPGNVFIDENPSDPFHKRFKMCCSYTKPGTKEYGVYIAGSDDGVSWDLLSTSPAFRNSDTFNICFYDKRIHDYVGYVRLYQPLRKVARCEFNDILHWGPEKVVLSYDPGDEASLSKQMFSGMDIYTSAACQYPGTDNAYLMFPSMYYHYTEAYAAKLKSPNPKNDGTMDVQFAVSRDGQHWSRIDRQPFISIGPPGSFDSGYAYVAYGMILRSDEIWLYYSTADFTHGNYVIARDRYKGAITRARLRLDGFVSADASYQGASFTTPVLTTSGGELYLNATTSAGGYVSVGVQDETAKDVPGYAIADCVPVNGDRIKAQVAWQAGTRILVPQNGRIRLVFSMRDTKLYSFQFAN
jgi:hypothetical protein